MKRVYPRLAKYTIGILVLSLAFVFSVQGQEPVPSPASPTAEPAQPTAEPVGAKAKDANATSDDPDTVKPVRDPFDMYEFPTRRERFDRYVSDTVGPARLARTAAAAGFSQWRDSPEEWEQGMKGYGKRFAASFGRNAIQQTITFGLDQSLN